MKILVTYAVQGEFTELKFPGLIEEEEVHIGYIRTGVGKVKSAYYVSEVLNQAKPDLVINVGTAGSIDCQIGDILVCRHFIDRDMQKLADMGLEYEIDSSALLAEKGYCMHWAGEGICNTGDTFLTELSDVKGDVVDMEAFAQAFVCRAKTWTSVRSEEVQVHHDLDLCQIGRGPGYACCNNQEYYFYPYIWNDKKYAVEHGDPHQRDGNYLCT